VPAGLSGVKEVAAGNATSFSLALKSDGTVVAWGDNQAGETTVPAGLSGVKEVAAGNATSFSLALKSDGTVVAWGANNLGQTNVPAGLSGVTEVVAGFDHSLALKSDGTVVAWGANVAGETTVPAGLSGVTEVAVGDASSLALKSDGTVVAWGDYSVPAGLSGVTELAQGAEFSLAIDAAPATVVAWGSNYTGETTVPAGLSGVTEVAAGTSFSLALKSDGTVVAWGDNNLGQTTVPAGLAGVKEVAAGQTHSLALKSDGTVVAWGDNGQGGTTVPAGLSGVTEVAAGYEFSLALKSDGTVVAWGADTYHQTDVPAGLADVVEVAAGGGHSLALKSDGTVVAWGDFGQGGTTMPAGLSGVKEVAEGELHSLALKSDGTVVAWGPDDSGDTTVPAAAQSGVTEVAAGPSAHHSLALKSDGTVVNWGNNIAGQPTVPPGLSGVVQVAGGLFFSLAINEQQAQTINFASLANQVYGVAPFSLGATASSGLPVSYTVSGPAALSGNTLTVTGAGVVDVTASQAGNAAYSAAPPVDQSFTVSQAPLSVVVDSKTMVYGAQVPTLTGTLSGVVNGDDITAAYGTTATSASDVVSGGYAITATLNDPGNRLGNYTVTNTPGTLTITQANQTINWSNPTDIVYGTALGGGQLNAAVSVVGPAAAGALTYSPAAPTVLHAGNGQTLTVTAAQTQDYSAATASVTINVSPAALTITPDNQTKVFGSLNPPLTASYSGFVNGDSAASLTTQPTLATMATTSSPVGSYPITAIGAADSDYTITYGSGILTVTLPSQSAYVLNGTAKGALSASGNAVVKLPGGLYVDSSSASAIVATGNAQVNVGGAVLVVGGVSSSGNGSCTATGTPPATNDPLAALPLPAVTDSSNNPLPNYEVVSISGNNTQTLNPGIFTSIQVSGHGSAILNSGTYIIEGGGLAVSGHGSLTWSGVGNGVTIFNAGSLYNGTTDGGTFGSISIGGKGTITLSAPTTGAYAGVAIFQSRANSKTVALDGSGTDSITGAVYAAAANVGLSGNAQVTGSLVASTLTVTGNAGAFQLTDGSSSSYTVSTCNWISNGVLTVWAEDDTGNGLNSDQVNRVSDAMTYLNSALGSYGVTLSWAAEATSADVTVHFATTTPEGDASAGVIGFTTADNNVYFVTTWTYYNGSDPTQIASNQLDFETLAIHELAHTVGLGESDDANSVMYEYLAAGTVRRTFTDSNLSLINTNSDRYMKFAGGSGVGAEAFLEALANSGSFGANAGLNWSPSGGELSRTLGDWTQHSDAVYTIVAARSSDEGMAATGRHGARVLPDRGGTDLDRFWEAYAPAEILGLES
jgi:alpha-tubulin suppressor-like RCC1 family protein